MNRTFFVLLFVGLCVILIAFEVLLAAPYLVGFQECGPGVLQETPQLNSSFYSVGPPLFAYPQLVLLPGSTATINMSYTLYDGNDLHQLLQRGFGTEDYGPYYSIDNLGQFQQVDPGSTGITFSSSPIAYLSNDSAYQIITITVAPNAPSATYGIGWVGCTLDRGCYLINIGSFPYWEPLRGCIQIAAFLICVGISAIIVLLVAIINFFWAHRSALKAFSPAKIQYYSDIGNETCHHEQN